MVGESRIKVSIVEDEPGIRKLLCKIIERQEGFQVVSECADFASAVTGFTKYRPEVVFMDIDLGGESGLECAKVMTEINPKVKIIFATAHSEYMANAFEIYAFDYLVKPFNVERVAKTLSRVKEMVETEAAARTASAGEGDITGASPACSSERGVEKLMIKGRDQIILVDKKDIIMIERCENATNIITEEEVLKTSVSLSGLEEKLKSPEFMRCHKSYIINVSRITKIEPYGRWTYVVRLKGTNATALMTTQNYEKLKALFGSL